jgi:hypothetical protein
MKKQTKTNSFVAIFAQKYLAISVTSSPAECQFSWQEIFQRKDFD